jgi:SAM-dependent methyltransferase
MACWNATAESVNPQKLENIDAILQRLNSPAPQSFFVLERAFQQEAPRGHKNYVLREISSFVIKPGYKLVVSGEHDEQLSLPRHRICWDVIPSREVPGVGKNEITLLGSECSTIQLANQALSLVSKASEDQIMITSEKLDCLANRAMKQLYWTLGLDVRGRSAIDAAFMFALAGVCNEKLYETLTCIAKYELRRVGKRPSFRSKYVLQMVEKLAAAGAHGTQVEELYQVAADCLETKGEHLDTAQTLSNRTGFDLLSPRSLLWLWRFSARQTKPKATDPSISDDKRLKPLETHKFTRSVIPMLPNFQNNCRPLIVDLGCGLGVSLLGLATTSTSRVDERYGPSNLLEEIDYESCNFLGADLSQLAIGYARGIGKRWGVNDKLQYSWASAEQCLDMIDASYKGRVPLIMIQFPTPYRLVASKSYGNSQLPSDQDSGFMVSERLLRKISTILSRSGGKLLLQSNCEDVAVAMRHTAVERAGMRVIDWSPSHRVNSIDDESQTLRSMDWIRLGGERAVGPGWLSTPVLPPRGATETEVACHLQKKLVHRCLLSPM